MLMRFMDMNSEYDVMQHNALKRLHMIKKQKHMRARMIRIRFTLTLLLIFFSLCFVKSIFTSNSTVDREVLASELMEKQSGKGLRIVKNKKKTEKIIPKCTDEIEEFVDKYPESLSLAVNYPKWHDKEPEMKLKKADMEGNRIPLLFQWDKRWAYQEYGDGILGTTGCGPTSLVMVYSGITGKRDYSPAHMAKWAEKKGYYVENVGSSWLLMSEGAEELGLNVKTLHITKEEIEKELQDGKAVICSMHAGDFTQSGHFIVLTGMEQDGTICINDCNSPERSQRQWDLDTIIEQMDAGWSYSL